MQDQQPKLGRPSKYSDQLVAVICERLAEGESLRHICDEPDMPSFRTVFRWLEANPIFCQQYARAREVQAHNLAERAVSEGMSASTKDDAQAARVRFDALRWMAGKLAPKVYGDKFIQEHTGADGGPVALTIDRPPTETREEWNARRKRDRELSRRMLGAPVGSEEAAGGPLLPLDLNGGEDAKR